MIGAVEHDIARHLRDLSRADARAEAVTEIADQRTAWIWNAINTGATDTEELDPRALARGAKPRTKRVVEWVGDSADLNFLELTRLVAKMNEPDASEEQKLLAQTLILKSVVGTVEQTVREQAEEWADNEYDARIAYARDNVDGDDL